MSGEESGPLRRLLLAEKPAQGRALAEALLRPEGRRWEENAAIGWTPDGVLLACAWACGHLLKICPPEAHNPAWAQFRWEDLPLEPPGGQFRRACVDGKGHWLRRIGELAHRANEVVNACDAGREGELIFWEIMDWCGIDADGPKVRRIWITDTTPAGLRRAWAEAMPSAKFARLRSAARARAAADWIWGFNGTRMVTIGLPPPPESRPSRNLAVWPIGRVQTPVLALIEDRCQEIASFRPETFWRMEGEFKGGNDVRFKAWLVSPAPVRFGHTETHFRRSSEADEMRRALLVETGRPWLVEDSREEGRQSPPPLFDLVDLQRSANRLWGWPAAHTAQVAQHLYERDHAISYPRTDSASLPTAMWQEIKSRYANLWRDWALSAWPKLAGLSQPGPLEAQHFDDQKVTDHHAIIPTGIVPTMAAREPGRVRPERILWELIAVRFLLAWLPPVRIAHARRLLRREGGGAGTWHAVLEADPVEDPGWLAYEDATMNTTGIGPPLAQRLAEKSFPPVGGTALLREVHVKLGHTTAPHYYNDDLLLQKMVASGLGTSSTRAETIAGLEDSVLIERGTIGGRFVSTQRGAQLIGLLRASPGAVFADAKETEIWERQLELIERRREPLSREQFLKNIIERLRRIKIAMQMRRGTAEMTFCPDTGRPIGGDEQSWLFPPGGRLAGVRCPKTIAQRPMSAADFVQILLGGPKGGGPFEGFVGRSGPFTCWLVYSRREGRFNFLFKSRGIGWARRSQDPVREYPLPLSRYGSERRPIYPDPPPGRGPP